MWFIMMTVIPKKNIPDFKEESWEKAGKAFRSPKSGMCSTVQFGIFIKLIRPVSRDSSCIFMKARALWRV